MYAIHGILLLLLTFLIFITYTYADHNNGTRTQNPQNATKPTNLTIETSLKAINIPIEGGEVDTLPSKPPKINTNVTESRRNGTATGREGELLQSTSSTTTVTPSTSTNEKIIPIAEIPNSDIVSEKADNKKTVPRKGVTFSTTTTTTTTTLKPTTKKVIPKKPLITTADDDEPYAPSHFVSSKGKNVSASLPKAHSIESYESAAKSKGSTDYIVPIVGVILSVPLVAILLNVIYKKSKEWWHHRHYSRMDFLIDGMYNS